MADMLQELIACKMRLAESEDRSQEKAKQLRSAKECIQELTLETNKVQSENKAMQEAIVALTDERISLRKTLEEASGTHLFNRIDSQETEEEKNRLSFEFKDNEELNNTAEWNSVLEQWDHLGFKGKLKLRTLAKQGIPAKLRGAVWSRKIHNKLHITPELFTMLARNRDTSEENGSSLIPADLQRTLGGLQTVQEEQSLCSALTELLEVFAAYRPDIGCSQGMAYFGSILLSHVRSYKSFECFANIVLGSELLRTFYSFDTEGIYSYYRVFQYYMKKQAPLISAYFDQIELTPDAYLLEWVCTLFSRCFPLDVVR